MSEKNTKALKPGWRLVKFGDVVRLSKARSQDPLADGFERYVGLEHLEPGDLRIRSWGNVADGVTFTSVFQPGQVLFGKRRAYQRKVAVADFSGVCSGDIYVLETKDAQVLLPELLPFICQTDAFFDHAVGTSAGSLSPRTNWSSLADFEFALPPTDGQLRIVSAIAAIDQCFEACRTLQVNGSALLQSLLDRMWRTFPKQKIGALIDQGLIAPPQDGNHGEKHPKAADYVPEGVPFVMASDLKGGQVDLTGCCKIPDSLARTLRIGFARSGDVLLSHKGTVGEVARLRELMTDFVMLTPQVTYYRVINGAKLEPDWLYFAFQTPGFKRLLEQYGKQSTRAYVGITTQRELSIPIAQVPDQQKVIAELVAVEVAIAGARERAASVANMRQRLLTEALAGGDHNVH
ncbi:type I restriction modification DNA specificity domain protein [Burkholderia pseudomallei MSHR7500]|uniref:restriction endonuclease subunit S n=1 Tax=Burkholderia pseudomallei TaxID=28450 RepID=UPI0005311930|nr:restriction endonuclease subunit S [Burkholderia pseudomallei]KGS83913.1 type I restriction modification DNA specificity domain protein [Burkholderia pseudomallei MSHR7500]KGV60480.1 type I restriction modification DNA specificity domain protein [Burkholderia pseudomallei ABCPW 91]